MSTVGTLYDETVKFGFARLLQVQNAAGAAVVDFVSSLNTANDSFMFDCETMRPTTDAASLLIRISSDGGATWPAGANYSCQGFGLASHAGNPGAGYGSATGALQNTSIFTGNTQTNGTYTHGGFRVCLYRGSSGLGVKVFVTHGIARHPTLGSNIWLGGGGCVSSGSINGVRFVYSAGNFAAGTIRLWGMRTGTGA